MDQIRLTKYCHCGVEGELKQFSTFSYYYCPQCKDEIQDVNKVDTEVRSREPRFSNEYTFEEWKALTEDMYSQHSDWKVVHGIFPLNQGDFFKNFSQVQHKGCYSLYVYTERLFNNRKHACLCGKEIKL